MEKINKRNLFSRNKYKSFEEVNKMNNEELYNFILENPKKFRFDSPLDIKNSCIFLHKGFLKAYPNTNDLIKNIVKKKWYHQLITRQPTVITTNVYSISDDKIKDILNKEESKLIEYEMELFNSEIGEWETVKKQHYEIYKDNQLIHITPAKKKIVYKKIYKIKKLNDIKNIGFIYEWLSTVIYNFGQHNQSIELLSIPKSSTSQKKINDLLYKMHSLENRNEEYGEKYRIYNVGKNYKKISKQLIKKHLILRYPIPTFFKSFENHISKLHNIFLKFIDINIAVAESYQLAINSHYKSWGETEEHKEYLINHLRKTNDTYQRDFYYLLHQDNSIKHLLTPKASLKLLKQKSYIDVNESFKILDKIYYVNPQLRYDTKNNPFIKQCRKRISSLIKDKWFTNQKLNHLVYSIFKEQTNLSAKGFQLLDEFITDNKEEKYYILQGVITNHLSDSINLYAEIFNYKHLTKYIGDNINFSSFHDFFLYIRTLDRMDVIRDLTKYKKQLISQTIEILLKHKYSQFKTLYHSINSLNYAIEILNRQNTVGWKKDKHNIYNEIDTYINNNDIHNIHQLADKLEVSVDKYALSDLTTSEQQNILENIMKPIKRYAKNVSVSYIKNWLGKDTFKQLSTGSLSNPFPLLEIPYISNDISNQLKEMIGVRSQGIKGKYNNPKKLFNAIQKEGLSPKKLIHQEVGKKEADIIYKVFKRLNIETDKDKKKYYDLTCKVEDKNSGNYLIAGDASVCCMSLGEDIMRDYVAEKGFSIINFYYKDRIIANSLIWKQKDRPILVIDNVEVHPNYAKFNPAIEDLLFRMINELEDKINFEIAVIGKSFNDINVKPYTKKLKKYTEILEPLWNADPSDVENDFYSDAYKCEVLWIKQNFNKNDFQLKVI